MQKHTQQMNASSQFCPNQECKARGKIGQGNIVIHSRKRPRYRCKECGKTFSMQNGTMFAGLRKPTEWIVIVVTLLSYGCPIQAIVHAYGVDERTIASWRERAGKHCQQIHQALVQQGQLDLVHVQADEIRVKGRKMVAWMGLALMVSTRLWLGGVVSLHRDCSLADRLLQQVRACCQPVRAVLVSTDGWAAYPGSIKRAFREKVKQIAGRGRACLQVWSELWIATVIKRTEKKRVVEVTRKMTWGTLEQANKLLQASLGGTVLNTAFIERFNGTMRERLASLTRKCRHAACRLELLSTWREISQEEASATSQQGIPVLLCGEHAWEHTKGASGTWSPNKNMRVIISGNAGVQPEAASGTDYAVCYLDPQRGTFSNTVWKAWFASDTATMLEGGDHSTITFFGPCVQFPYTTHNTVIAADGQVHEYVTSAGAVQGFQTLLPREASSGSQVQTVFPQFCYYHEVTCPSGVYRLEFFGPRMDERGYQVKEAA